MLSFQKARDSDVETSDEDVSVHTQQTKLVCVAEKPRDNVGGFPIVNGQRETTPDSRLKFSISALLDLPTPTPKSKERTEDLNKTLNDGFQRKGKLFNNKNTYFVY